MICNFRKMDRKWIPYRGSEWRPTRSPCLWGSCPAPGSCPWIGPAGPASLVSSLAPGKSPPCTGPSLCCWDLHTSHTQADPSIGNMSAGLNSSGLKERKRVRDLCCISYQYYIGKFPLPLPSISKSFKLKIFLNYFVFIPVSHICPCLFILMFIYQGSHLETNGSMQNASDCKALKTTRPNAAAIKILEDVAFRIVFSRISASSTDNKFF